LVGVDRGRTTIDVGERALFAGDVAPTFLLGSFSFGSFSRYIHELCAHFQMHGEQAQARW
jgi:hypothetical protein